MYNLGRPTSVRHNTSIQAIRKEIYDEEQNEILEMNHENTRRTMEAKSKANENIMNIHNMDMSQEVPIMPAYIPIIEEHHGVMFANSSKEINDVCFTHILSDIDTHEELLAHEVNDTETFAYRSKMSDSNTPMVEAVYFNIDKAKKVLFDGEMYAQFEYDEGRKLMVMYKNELEIPAFIDNGASVNVLPKAFYDKHPILHKLPKVKANMQPIMTGNGPIPAYFWIDITLQIQGIHLQLCCIVCDLTAGHGLLISRLSLDQMQAIQLYDKRQVLVKMNAIPLIAAKGATISPNQKTAVPAELQITDTNLRNKLI